ncbi:MAG: cyclase family protein [Bdellovibrionales bacterium]
MKPLAYDISPVISPKLGVFPGDQPFSREVVMSFTKGDHLELSRMTSTVHLGAHADAPSHYHEEGVSIDQRPWQIYLGKAQVIRVTGLSPKARVEPKHIKTQIEAPRVLIDTCSFPDPNKWNSNFNSFSPELLEFLAGRGVKLVGIDTPSVDPEDSKALESHQILFKRDLAVLEGLLLKEVPEGLYTLIALPLRIAGADASPVRALLLGVDYFSQVGDS